jgi:hypothetical protein
LTVPAIHNGIFYTLREALDRYHDLQAFLESLTDERFR